jgi:hypothetical protein
VLGGRGTERCRLVLLRGSRYYERLARGISTGVINDSCSMQVGF